METQLKKKMQKIHNKIKYWFYKNFKGYDREELQYLIDDEEKTAEDIYAEEFGDYKREKEKKAIKVQTASELDEAKKKTNSDSSQIDLKKESIEGRNLENCGLKINLRELKIPENIKESQISDKEYFIRLEKTNLKGNEIIGDLRPIYIEGIPIYFSYVENTFGESYKKRYPEFFLDDKAPPRLKSKYYSLIHVTEVRFTEAGEQVFSYNKRSELDFSEYIANYEFLKGKYLGNFRIASKELLKIQFVENFGLEEAVRIIGKIANSPVPFYTVLKRILEGKGQHLYGYDLNPATLSNEEEVNQMRTLIRKYKEKSTKKNDKKSV